MSLKAINQIYLKGYLTNDVELKQAPSGHKYVIYSICINMYNRKKQQNEPNYVNVITNGYDAEYLAKNGKKGVPIELQGFIRTGMFTDQHGQHKNYFEVITSDVAILQKQKHATQDRQQTIEPEEPEKTPQDTIPMPTNIQGDISDTKTTDEIPSDEDVNSTTFDPTALNFRDF